MRARRQSQITRVGAGCRDGGHHRRLTHIGDAVVVHVIEDPHLRHTGRGFATERQARSLRGDRVAVRQTTVVRRRQNRRIAWRRLFCQNRHRQGCAHRTGIARCIGLVGANVVHARSQVHRGGESCGRRQLVFHQNLTRIHDAVVVGVVKQRHIVACARRCGGENQSGGHRSDVVARRGAQVTGCGQIERARCHRRCTVLDHGHKGGACGTHVARQIGQARIQLVGPGVQHGGQLHIHITGDQVGFGHRGLAHGRTGTQDIGYSPLFHATIGQGHSHHRQGDRGVVVIAQETAVAGLQQVWCRRCHWRCRIHTQAEGIAGRASLSGHVVEHRAHSVSAAGWQRQIGGVGVGRGHHQGADFTRIEQAVVVGIGKHTHLGHARRCCAAEGQRRHAFGHAVVGIGPRVIDRRKHWRQWLGWLLVHHGHFQCRSGSAGIARGIGLEHADVVHTGVQIHITRKCRGRDQLVADQGFALIHHGVVVLVVEHRHRGARHTVGGEGQARGERGDVIGRACTQVICRDQIECRHHRRCQGIGGIALHRAEHTGVACCVQQFGPQESGRVGRQRRCGEFHIPALNIGRRDDLLAQRCGHRSGGGATEDLDLLAHQHTGARQADAQCGGQIVRDVVRLVQTRVRIVRHIDHRGWQSWRGAVHRDGQGVRVLTRHATFADDG